MPTVPGHAVVCGLDHLGLRTVDELRLRDEEVVAIGPTAEHRGAADRARASGSSSAIHRLTRILRRPAREQARRVIVLTGDDDLGNLNTALAAVRAQPGASGS